MISILPAKNMARAGAMYCAMGRHEPGRATIRQSASDEYAVS